MDKRFQVFVSSTYTDLQAARAEVMQALLELDCMPAGMELFPAANEEQWTWIKKVIDESDYYVMILAGRYGSVSQATGQSYTEMEYRYAVDIKKPVIAFVHENPAKLLAEDCEPTEAGRAQLNSFRELVQTRLCKLWSTPADLGAKVSRSITQLMKQHPAIGWIRANAVSNETAHETLSLRRQVEELQAKLQQVSAVGPPQVQSLSHGVEIYEVAFAADRKDKKPAADGRFYWVKGERYSGTAPFSWDDLFAYIAPMVIDPKPEYQVHRALAEKVAAMSIRELQKQFPDSKFENFRLFNESYDTIKIQLRALGLIALTDGKWTLTEYGDAYMNRLLAVPRQSKKTQRSPKKQQIKRRKR